MKLDCVIALALAAGLAGLVPALCAARHCEGFEARLQRLIQGLLPGSLVRALFGGSR